MLKKKAESEIKNKFMKDPDTSDRLRALRLLLSTVRSLSLSGVGSDLSYLEIIPWRVTLIYNEYEIKSEGVYTAKLKWSQVYKPGE